MVWIYKPGQGLIYDRKNRNLHLDLRFFFLFILTRNSDCPPPDEKIVLFLSSFIYDYGYLNLFVLSFLASTALPVGSEALVVALIHQGFSPFYVIMVATTGNFLGSCLTYFIGLKGRSVLEKYFSPSPEKLEKSEKLFKRYGIYTLFFTWVPWIGDVIAMVAGLMHLSFKNFSIPVFLGKLARYVTIAYLTSILIN